MKIIKKTAICIAIYPRKEDWSIDILVLSSSFSCRPDASISFFSFVFLSSWYFLFSLVTSRQSPSLLLYLPSFFLFLIRTYTQLKSTSPFAITPFSLSSILCAARTEREKKNHYYYYYQHQPNDVVCENVC